ncbi:MAG: DNA mismatch repair endonuclease MutL [Bacteriovoracaceae bacterium]|nr:DNA mismatch repair endonuclease MutL [Bacteriovoracaceae bacterium]
MNQSITVLSEHVIDQIKAGEVVERPANLLKELIENALDAKAQSIHIEIAANHLDYISVRDDGKGISFEQMPLAFARHATSKIKEFEDLYKLSSFGFRGEALSSIASVSNIICLSKTVNADGGKLVLKEGKKELHIAEKKISTGTTLFVGEIFHNTPVRLKFIKSKIAERNALLKVLHSFILSRPDVSFSFCFEEEERQEFTGCVKEQNEQKENEIMKRLQTLFCRKKNNEIKTFQKKHEDYNIYGFYTQGSPKDSFIFVNGRPIIDKQIHHLIQHHLSHEISFLSLLFIELPAHHMDINVHPAKTTVKFYQMPLLLSLISHALQENKIASLLPKPLSPSKEANPFKNPVVKEKITASTSLTSFPHGMILLQKDQHFYLFDLKQIVRLHLLNHFVGKEHLANPLMVSEPFYISNRVDAFFKNFMPLGLEFDRLNPHMIVLRSLPAILSPLPFPKIIQDFLNFLNSINSKEDSQNNFSLLWTQFLDTHLQVESSDYSLPYLTELITFFDFSSLLETKIVRPLQEHHLRSIYDSK